MLSHSVVSDSLRPYGLQTASVHGILQARILEWTAISSSRGSSQGWLRCFQFISCISVHPVLDIIESDSFNFIKNCKES